MSSRDTKTRIVIASIIAWLLICIFVILLAILFVYISLYLYSGSSELFFGSSKTGTDAAIALVAGVFGMIFGAIIGGKIWVLLMKKTNFVSQSFINKYSRVKQIT